MNKKSIDYIWLPGNRKSIFTTNVCACKCSPFVDCDDGGGGQGSLDSASQSTVSSSVDCDDGGGGQCSVDSASQSLASSSAALLTQSLLICTSLYSGLFNFNHCRAASPLLVERTGTYSVPCNTASSSAS